MALDRTTEVVYENYVQTKGIRAGPGSFDTALDECGKLVRELRIEPANGLCPTAAHPERLMSARRRRPG